MLAHPNVLHYTLDFLSGTLLFWGSVDCLVYVTSSIGHQLILPQGNVSVAGKSYIFEEVMVKSPYAFGLRVLMVNNMDG